MARALTSGMMLGHFRCHAQDAPTQYFQMAQTYADAMIEHARDYYGDRHSPAFVTSDVRGLAIATDGLVVLHEASVEGLSAEGERLWTVAPPSPPVRWGVALTGAGVVVTLTNGQVVCLGSE